ncbi:ScyD/ScyE family protein [Streptomyces sp. NPDC060322]|uniref:ScyD/ScyE family protein n=1 Tax=unclassified Streptomyces TaxID=2593676 RepID=UPI003653A120
MSNSLRSWKGALVPAMVAAGVTAPLLAGPAQAAPREATIEVLATGLKNPRDITALRDGTLLVAEAGEGLPGCATGTACAGLTGAVYRVKGESKGRVVEGLQSYAKGPAAGAPVSASGPNQVVPAAGGGYTVLSSYGGTTDSRAQLGADGTKLGTLYRTRDGKVLADPVDHETRLNPDGGDVHSNPWGFVPSGDGWLITDAGANTVLRADSRGRVSTAFVLPKNELPTGAAEGVPTGVVTARNGTVYVADMSGTKTDASRIWKIAPGQRPEVLVTGLTNLVDLDLDCKGNLIALSFTKGFQQGPPLPGALSRIDVRSKQITEIPTGNQLVGPTGLEVGPRGQIYVTNNSNGTDGRLVEVTP